MRDGEISSPFVPRWLGNRESGLIGQNSNEPIGADHDMEQKPLAPKLHLRLGQSNHECATELTHLGSVICTASSPVEARPKR